MTKALPASILIALMTLSVSTAEAQKTQKRLSQKQVAGWKKLRTKALKQLKPDLTGSGYVKDALFNKGRVLSAQEIQYAYLTRRPFKATRPIAAYKAKIPGKTRSIWSFSGYLMSNEGDTGRNYPIEKLVNKGGGYAGVGAEQNYTLMAMGKSKFGWLFDVDPRVNTLHEINAIAFRSARTANAFVSFYAPVNREHIEKKLTEISPKLGKFYAYNAAKLHRQYTSLRIAKPTSMELGKSFIGVGGYKSFLSEPSFYLHVRNMFSEGNVQIGHGNLFHDRVVGKIANAAIEVGTKIEVLYTSNALSKPYGNIGSMTLNRGINKLPISEKSLLLSSWKDHYEFNKIPTREIQEFGQAAGNGLGWSFSAIPIARYRHYTAKRPSAVKSALKTLGAKIFNAKK